MSEERSLLASEWAARGLLVGVIAIGVFSGCRKQQASGGPPPNPPTLVVAAEAKRQPIAETLAVVGSLAANEFVEVKSETEGTVAEILFQEGQPVTKGALLIRLDETKFSASLAEAEANLKMSQTTFDSKQAASGR
jgi:membrane fusion protein (multidrug efflux system)